MTNEDQQIIRAILAESEGRIIARQDAAVESIAADFSELRETRRHIETLQKRFDNLAPVIISLDARLGAFTRAVDNVLKEPRSDSRHPRGKGRLTNYTPAWPDSNSRTARSNKAR
jgi:hypothetical protein